MLYTIRRGGPAGPDPEPQVPHDAKGACFADLASRILAHELAPGLVLDEARLAEQYRISRTPLREVLQRLAGRGYVRIEARRGARVASLDLMQLRTFFRTAPMIYASIARLAAEAPSGAGLEVLRQAQDQLDRAVAAGEAAAAALANHRFHAGIGEMAQNAYLQAALDRLLIDHTRLGHDFFRPVSALDRDRIGTALRQHAAMIAAIEARQPARVVELTLLHWDLSRDRMERFVRPDPLPADPGSRLAGEELRHAV